ncbi:unnamed protein product [Parajaminaea phylloscopi]
MPGLRPGLDTSSGNAESKAETTASGANTHGIVNCHPAAQSTLPASSSSGNTPATSSADPAKHARNEPNSAQTADGDAASTLWPFKVGVAEDRNKRWRRTMEDAHAFVYNFGGVHGQGYFSIFDGHAGKHAAEWCGRHFHEYLIETVVAHGSTQSVPDLLNTTFHSVDRTLEQLATKQGTSSGCTAVACFLRLEDDSGKPLAHSGTGGINKAFCNQLSGVGGAALPGSEADGDDTQDHRTGSSHQRQTSRSSTSEDNSKSAGSGGGLLSSFAKRIRKASSDKPVNEVTDKKRHSNSHVDAESVESSKGGAAASANAPAVSDSPSSGQTLPSKSTSDVDLTKVSSETTPRRVLYTANVGDARAVLSRKGHAVRLTYDHKASDAQEAKRITDAGGFVMNNRVNAVLAVTRSLGDSAMKKFVVGAPYTTETTLTDDDSFLIVACDGLWDVTDDQDAVDLIANVHDPQQAAQTLLQHALSNFSTDNTSVMVVKFNADGSTPAGKAGSAGRAEGGAASGNRSSGSGSSEEVSESSSSSHGGSGRLADVIVSGKLATSQ